MLRTALNWLFHPENPAPNPQGATTQTDAALALGARLDVVERQLVELHTLPLQWTETLDKLQAWANRQNARDAKRVKSSLDQLGEGGETREDAPGPMNGARVDLTQDMPKGELRRLYHANRMRGLG